MRLTVLGTGYVGLVTGACFAEMGNHVTCVDRDAAKIQRLERGEVPIYEPGLEPLVAANLHQGRLRFTTNLPEAVAGAEVIFIAVGTPPRADGSADVEDVLAAARDLGACLDHDAVVVVKSTVPVGTTERVEALITEALSARREILTVDVAFNPEFLKEGDAVNDFMRPDRVIVGSRSPRAIALLRMLYAPFTRNHERLLTMAVRDAEMTKYAANAMLATRISFMNELATICERLDVDVEQVRVGIGSDPRIGYSFIYPGCGYGGSCFPKDVRALIRLAQDAGVDPGLLRATEARNQAQKRLLFDKLAARFGGRLAGLGFGVWGLAFKPGTDDMREAPAVTLIAQLIEAGATVSAFDPAAMNTARTVFPKAWFDSGRLRLADDPYDALRHASALLLVTEWKQFRSPDLPRMRRIMRLPVIFDGRNQFEPGHMAAQGFEYHGIGRGGHGLAEAATPGLQAAG
ncbi:MAG: UDP-glucose 6-dehydrogenase [Burkholderiales bacterium]|nr:MAG: UDP-glucose 6-dehydrogenase [Burkholderiales bacterium]